jgi:UDP-3-O-[3-hydroxymyristoyl] glucosamine N-acyltransferase
MEFSAEQIAALLNGTVEGNPEATVNNIAKIEEGSEGKLSFLANPKYESYLYDCKSSIVLVNKDLELNQKVSTTLVRVDDAYGAFADILREYQKLRGQKFGIHPTAVIEESVTLGEDLYIGANAYIGENTVLEDGVKIYANTSVNDNVKIGKNTVINSGVNIYHDTVIGNNCTIHSGAVIGADGFGFAPNDNNDYEKVPQIGNVILEDNVDVGANATIDRATIGSTYIEQGVKIDNLVQVAHNVRIGKNTVVAAQSGIAGSTKVGKDCMFGGQVGISGHLEIADGVKAAAQSGIPSSIKQEGKIVQGTPAFDVMDFRKSYVYFRKLPKVLSELKK